MKPINLSNKLNAAVLIVGTIMGASVLADTQESGYDMGSGMMSGHGAGWTGGYGGIWVPILLAVAVAGLLGWIIAKKWK